MENIIDVSILLIISLIWIGSISFLYFNKKKSIKYILLFTLFYIYIYKVLDYTLFQFQSLILLKHFMPGLMLQGSTVNESLNLIPLFTLTGADVKTSLLNILLFVPFGFGLSLINKLRMMNVIIIGVLFSLSIESLQLVTGLIAHITFRVVDINDVIFNTLGVLIGYLIYKAVMQSYKKLVS